MDDRNGGLGGVCRENRKRRVAERSSDGKIEARMKTWVTPNSQNSLVIYLQFENEKSLGYINWQIGFVGGY